MKERRFLVITDDLKEQARIKKECEERGNSSICYTVKEAQCYISMLEKKEAEINFNIVLIDIDLPNDDAIALCEQIQKLDSKIVIIGVRSAENQHKVGVTCCRGMLLKPASFAVLEMILSNINIGL